MNYNEHKDNPKSFCALTSLNHIQDSHLLHYFESAHDDYLSEYELTVIQPIKKRKGKMLSEGQKEFNKKVYYIRGRMEDYIGSLAETQNNEIPCYS